MSAGWHYSRSRSQRIFSGSGQAGSVSDSVPGKQSRKSRKTQPAYEAEFSQWYGIFPRHEKRAEGADAYTRAVVKLTKAGKTETEAEAHAYLLERSQDYAQHVAGSEPKYIALPASWLNSERWTDTYSKGMVNENGSSNGHKPAPGRFAL